MRYKRLEIRADRWPWQSVDGRWDNSLKKLPRYGWFTPLLLGRFGGGWDYKLGVAVSSSTVIIDALFGSVRITWHRPEGRTP